MFSVFFSVGEHFRCQPPYFSFFSVFCHHVIAIAAQDFDHMTFNLSKESRKVEFKRRCTRFI
jgi:hypothetical protein